MSDPTTLKIIPSGTIITESAKPDMYRLAHTPCGQIVLQGCYVRTTENSVELEWRTLETVQLPEGDGDG